MTVDYSLYFVTDPQLCRTADGGSKLVETALAAVKGGATLVQYRNPDAKGRVLFEEAAALKKALKPLGVPLLINDRVDIALAVKADGVHLGQSDLAVTKARALMGAHALIGLSIDKPQQITTQEEALCDYFGAGPVFSTTTKPDALPAIGLHGLQYICDKATAPVIAIGGIGADHLTALRKCGACGVAVVSAIAGQPDPEAASRNLRASWDKICSL